MDSAWDVKEVGEYVIYNKLLGKGNQATVFEAYRKDTLQPVAAKVFDRFKLAQTNQTKSMERQIQIQNTIRHPFIVDCYDIKGTSNNIYFFLEYCDGGDLEKYLKDNALQTESECLDLFKQIVEAFQLLTRHNIVHRDLKPANIMMKNGQLKIADFGFAKEARNDDVKNTIVGSPIYMCPQALDGSGQYDLQKGDVWSAGVCLYLMLYKRYPFYSTTIQDLIITLKQQQLVFHDAVAKRSDAVKDLLSSMLDKQQSTRFTWEQVANHKCFKQQSHYQDNPLLGSLEMNQVSGISGYNADLKNIQVDRVPQLPFMQSPDSTVQGQEGGTVQGQGVERQQSERERKMQDSKPKTERLKQIHSLIRLQSQFALIYRIIWKGFFQLLRSNDNLQTGVFVDNKLRNAMFILINSLLLKEQRFLRDLVSDARSCVAFRLRKHKLDHILQSDMEAYFASEVFKAFQTNLRSTYENDTLVSVANYLELLQAHLIEAGFKQQLNMQNCNNYIEISLSIITEQIPKMSQNATAKNDKTFIILILYLFFLLDGEERIQKFSEPTSHYQAIMRKLEAINFMDTAQIQAKIAEYIAKHEANDEMEEEEEEEVEKEEESEDSEMLRFT